MFVSVQLSALQSAYTACKYNPRGAVNPREQATNIGLSDQRILENHRTCSQPKHKLSEDVENDKIMLE